MRFKLLEAEDFDFDEEEIIDNTEDEGTDEIDGEEIVQEPNQGSNPNLKTRNISIPVLVEQYDSEGNSVETDFSDKEDMASEYADQVTQKIEENKKFILSALDIYDLECYYKDYDYNSFVNFVIEAQDSVKNDFLWNVINRYFNLQVSDESEDGSIITVSPVLDRKYIKIS